MENFFIQYSSQKEFTTESVIYDNASFVDKDILVFGNYEMKLPFSPLFFKNFTYDLFLISESQYLYRINKFRKELEELGMIEDKILCVEANNTNIIIVTNREILVFNDYFDLIKNIDVDQFNTCENLNIVIGTDLFALISKDFTVFYDISLNFLGKSDLKIKSAVYISKYNIFACATGESIQFIEPNGLECGDPIDLPSDKLFLLDVDGFELLVSSKNSVSTLLYMKNFYWYIKLQFQGFVYKSERNSIVIKEGKKITEYFVFKKSSESFVIDGTSLLYTNLGNSIIPPPFYYKKLDIGEKILNLYHNDNLLYIAVPNKVIVYTIDENDNLNQMKEMNLPQKFDIINDMMVVNDNLLIRHEQNIFKVSETSFEPLNYYKLNDKSQILQIFNIFEKIGILFVDGTFWCNSWHKFEVDNSGYYHVQYMNSKNIDNHITKIYCLGCKKLQVVDLPESIGIASDLVEKCTISSKISLISQSKIFEIASDLIQKCTINNNILKSSIVDCDVSSFLIYNNNIIYIKANSLIIKGDSEEYTSYAENGLMLLAVKDNRIIFQTLYGSLETITCHLFSKSIVKNHIKKGNIKLAADLCDSNHIDYEIFYEADRFPLSYIDNMSDNQILALISILSFDKEKPYLIENDILLRYLAQFDPQMAYNNVKKSLSELEKEKIDDDVYIKNDSINHIFNSQYKGTSDLKDKITDDNPTDFDNYKNIWIDRKKPINSVNNLLKVLDPQKHLNTIVNLFIRLNRMDLCFYLPNIQKVIKILLSKKSAESIAKASIPTLDISLIVEVYKLVQCDYAGFYNFFVSRTNLKFSIFDYLEDRKTALFYLIKDTLDDKDQVLLSDSKIGEYALKHNLLDELLMFQYFEIFEIEFYTFIAKHQIPELSYKLYVLSDKQNEAIQVSLDNLFWREALNDFYTDDLAYKFIDLLSKKSMFESSGEIYEIYLKDDLKAIESYLKAGAMRKALTLFNKGNKSDNKIKDEIRKISVELLKNNSVEFNEAYSSYTKYKERINTVRDKLNENVSLSQTSFSYTSQRSVSRALTKDRPGGVYEHEFVLNRIKMEVEKISSLRKYSQQLLEIFLEFGMDEYVLAHDQIYSKVKDSLRNEIDKIWEYERADYDPNRPVIIKPEVSVFFN